MSHPSIAALRLDLTRPHAEGRGTYEMPGHCTNCGAEYTLVISKGYEKPNGWGNRRAECSRCGCDRVVAV